MKFKIPKGWSMKAARAETRHEWIEEARRIITKVWGWPETEGFNGYLESLFDSYGSENMTPTEALSEEASYF
jgi:hypothetical protein